ncbi:flagellar basal body-associated FliL family protein [Aliigemmobacter aestuarii]|uniref:Flagellar protein FliL n=1 Tax=Aliigemmobacter aestuarii TaxID=1445661 RepID=A0A4S3MTS1_9RHOB|nr:flagellar basal body-associated FliL family protein [Gemmobacter aestuarii]THD85543.1 flagellar basal body-associated FliL family protein [Gemmobacter aestuarii]
MLRLVIPVVIVLLATGGGMAAGLFLRPPPDPAHAAEGTGTAGAEAEGAKGADQGSGTGADDGEGHQDAKHQDSGETAPEYVKLNNQFVVPVVEEGRVRSLVILSLGLEVAPGTTEDVYAREPKLRDAFLQLLFDHANSGGFKGTFTDGANLILLRRSLLESAQRVLGQKVTDVLISEMARQDS